MFIILKTKKNDLINSNFQKLVVTFALEFIQSFEVKLSVFLKLVDFNTTGFFFSNTDAFSQKNNKNGKNQEISINRKRDANKMV